MSSFVPRIEHQQRKMNHLRNDGEFVEKKMEPKGVDLCHKKVHLFQSRQSQEKKHHYDFRKQYLVEGVNDVEKRLRWSSAAAARVLYSTFLLHYLAVFGGVLDDHRYFCVWFLFYFPSLV